MPFGKAMARVAANPISVSRQGVYSRLKKRIPSDKLKKGQRLSYDGVVHEFSISRWAAHKVISQLKKDGLLVSGDKTGSFVV